jgi:hypothetical protein
MTMVEQINQAPADALGAVGKANLYRWFPRGSFSYPRQDRLRVYTPIITVTSLTKYLHGYKLFS